ncbi:protein kinase [Gordonia sp. VNQ95]|uniref:protein kinase domain-containing protein n=1 Tax=Gordonia sp. VNQ95 TaxID=3156619 RepID=UPI0032B3ED0A
MATLAVGDECAGYRILRQIGVGGMGEVYLAQHPRLPRQDAVKVLAQALQHDVTFRERFNREADIAAGLLHPSIVPLYDRGESEGRLWISMAYIDGSDVASMLRENPAHRLPPTLVGEIVTAIADALDHAHETGLLHRDVKPANILVTRDRRRRIYLADFGIAKPQDSQMSLTATGLLVGSLAYCAPEQVLATEEITAAADQYQLACAAFEMLTGTTPFPASNLASAVHHHVSTPQPLASQRCPEVPRAVDGTFARAMAKRPEQRFACCADFADALTAALSDADAFVPLKNSYNAPTQVATPLPLPISTAPTPHNPTPQNALPHNLFQQHATPGEPGSPIRWAGRPLTPEQRRGLACGAYFALTSGADAVDALEIHETPRAIRRALRKSWAVTDSQTAFDMVESIAEGLITPDYDSVLGFIAPNGLPRNHIRVDPAQLSAFAAHHPHIPAHRITTCVQVATGSRALPLAVPITTAAWEIGQCVELARMCLHVGFGDEDWVHQLVLSLGERAAAAYPDWNDFAVAFEWGRALASAESGTRPIELADESCARTRPVLGRLLTDPGSPWLRTPLRG